MYIVETIVRSTKNATNLSFNAIALETVQSMTFLSEDAARAAYHSEIARPMLLRGFERRVKLFCDDPDCKAHPRAKFTPAERAALGCTGTCRGGSSVIAETRQPEAW